MTIRLSVCLTAYGRRRLLGRTLESLAAQTRLPDELIVCDDHSPEDPGEVVERWRHRFPRVWYHRNERNLSMPGNLNKVVGMATGEYVANLHDADVFDPALLAKWEAALDRHPTAGFAFCGLGGWHRPTRQGGGILLENIEPFTPGRVFFERYFAHRFRSPVWGTVMARRAAYDALLPFDAAYRQISDVDMWMRMCQRWDVAYVREPMIRLDNTPTPWRAFRWENLEFMRRMQRANLGRFYGHDPVRLGKELRRHRRVVVRVYLWRLLNRLRRGDREGWRAGVAAYRAAMAETRADGQGLVPTGRQGESG